VQPSQIGLAAIDVVVIGGVDPRGGAGLLRDVLTAGALGARPVAVGTAWTEQRPDLHRVETRAPEFLADAVRHASAGRPAAVKVGMIPDPGAAAAVLAGLEGYGGPVVVDPVLASSRGRALFEGAPAALLDLCRRAALVTPNAAEAEALAGIRVADLEDAATAARALSARGLRAVLVKGGHLGGPGEPATDTLVEGGRLQRFTRARVPGGDVRGTGCALATAIAVELGRGRSLAEAIETATAWLARAIATAVQVGAERHLGAG
jgi:hydroxymethylpyrimidine/phosphomethylpyrimidine kinase